MTGRSAHVCPADPRRPALLPSLEPQRRRPSRLRRLTACKCRRLLELLKLVYVEPQAGSLDTTLLFARTLTPAVSKFLAIKWYLYQAVLSESPPYRCKDKLRLRCSRTKCGRMRSSMLGLMRLSLGPWLQCQRGKVLSSLRAALHHHGGTGLWQSVIVRPRSLEDAGGLKTLNLLPAPGTGKTSTRSSMSVLSFRNWLLPAVGRGEHDHTVKSYPTRSSTGLLPLSCINIFTAGRYGKWPLCHQSRSWVWSFLQLILVFLQQVCAWAGMFYVEHRCHCVLVQRMSSCSGAERARMSKTACAIPARIIGGRRFPQIRRKGPPLLRFVGATNVGQVSSPVPKAQ